MNLIHEWPDGRLYVDTDGTLYAEYQLSIGVWLRYRLEYIGEGAQTPCQTTRKEA